MTRLPWKLSAFSITCVSPTTKSNTELKP
jgi:hypothetical protein